MTIKRKKRCVPATNNTDFNELSLGPRRKSAAAQLVDGGTLLGSADREKNALYAYGLLKLI